MERKRKNWMAILVLCCIIVVFIVFLLTREREETSVTYYENRYDASDLIQQSMSVLKKEGKNAQVISDVITTKKVLALTFKGLSDQDTNKKIIDLMSFHNRKGTFFVPGILAAEDSETILLLDSKGHKVESNTLSGLDKMEESSLKELVEDFCRANTIIKTILHKSPNLLLCNSTILTPDLLKAAYAAGNRKVVDSSHYLNYQSFHNYNQALNYVKGLKAGSIITIKMEGILEENEYGSPIDEMTPAIDKQPGIVSSSDLPESLSSEEKLVQVVGWLLQAMDEVNYETVPVEELGNYSDAEIDFKLLRKNNNGSLAKVYTKIVKDQNFINFSFRGIEKEEQLDEILDFLVQNHLKATFFVSGNDIINYPDRIEKIIDHYQIIANGGMSGKALDGMDFNEICLEIYQCDKLLREKFGVHSNLIMPAYGKYNKMVQEAASALNYSIVTYSKNPIIQEEQTLSEVKNYYKNGFAKGDIIHFKIDFYKDILNVVKETYKMACNYEKTVTTDFATNKSKITIENSYQEKEKGLSKTSSKNNMEMNVRGNNMHMNTSNNKDSIKNSWLKFLRLKNKGKRAEEFNTVYTTEQALSYTFYGISNKDVLNDVLKKLDILNAKATFFVTEKDVKNHPKDIKRIGGKGHEIGICLSTSTGIDFYSVCRSILKIQKEVKKLCGQKPELVRYAYDVNIPDQVLEALSSTGCQVVWQNLSLASSKLGVDASLEEVLDYAFNQGNITVRRGYIIYYRMDYYTDKKLIGKLMLNISKNRIDTIAYKDDIFGNGSDYHLKTLGSLMKGEIYEYPVKKNKIIASVKDAIYPGYLSGIKGTDRFQYIQERYVGTPSVNNISTLPGFNEEKIMHLDKTGRFTKDKVLFLTFDDWGSDKAINQLLYVLRKHDVDATFFVRTNFVQDNPNLLRAIALDGHDIGSHTNNHLPFAISSNALDEDDTSAIYSSPTEKEIEERRQDLLISYNKLQSIIGDVKNNGIPSLTKIFRPPTLAMSKEGMEAIFDMGFTYIVSGDFSTHDYEAKSKEELVDTIRNGIPLDKDNYQKLQNGSILIMHMSDDNVVPTDKKDITAEALDTIIPELKKQGYHFAKLSKYLP